MLHVGMAQKITYYKNIQPIIQRNCLECHIQNGAGPFDLNSYESVSKRAHTIQKVTTSGFMPPWQVDTNYSKLSGIKKLTLQDLKLIDKWIKKGMPKGDDVDLIKDSTLNITQTNLFGKPDLVLRMKNSVKITGDNKEQFIIYKFPFEIPFDTTVCYCEFIADKKTLVHHMDAFVYNVNDNVNVNQPPYILSTDSILNYQAIPFKFGLSTPENQAQEINGAVWDYFPGSKLIKYPDGIYRSFKINKKGAIVANSLHYGGSPNAVTDSSYFNIFYCKQKVDRQIIALSIGSPSQEIVPPLLIPPNVTRTFYSSYYTRFDLSLIAVQPHMHYIGKQFTAYAITPNKDTIKLIKIDKWDFRWQRQYKFKKMLYIPKGSEIVTEGHYDNTVNNPFNPSNPPQTIYHSIKTKDEMLQLWLYFVKFKKGDEKISLE